jgi:hypothetical protein
MLRKVWASSLGFLVFLAGTFLLAQTPSPALLVLEKNDKSMAIVDPGTLKVVGRVPAGEDPHEIIASDDGSMPTFRTTGPSRIHNIRSRLRTCLRRRLCQLQTSVPCAPLTDWKW